MRGAWLQDLPSVLGECVERWTLNVNAPFDGLTFNYAAPATRSDGTRVVLKLCPPDDEFHCQVTALELFDGCGCCRVIESDRERGAMVLERLEPGHSLSTVSDDERATTIAAEVMLRLWRPAPTNAPLPTLTEYARELLDLGEMGGTAPLPEEMVERAQRTFHNLLDSNDERYLLHGDFHHYNVLSASREPWLAIDAKGVIGPREYEVGRLLLNPWKEMQSAKGRQALFSRRLDQLAEHLQFDRERLRAWGFVEAMLSAVWDINDTGQAWRPSVAMAGEIERA